MAISITFNRTDNTFRVSAEVADTGKLRIQYNESDIYNNLSGSSNDITAGAEKSIPIPLVNGSIPLGVYRFDFDASAGASYDVACNFQIDDISPVLTETINTLTPSFRVDDDTDYAIANGTSTAAVRTITTTYPDGTSVADLSGTSSVIVDDTTTIDLYNSTYLLYEGVMQTVLTSVLTYTIAATTGYSLGDASTRQGFTYTCTVSGYSQSPQLRDSEYDDLYECIQSLKTRVDTAESQGRSDFLTLRGDYSYATGMLAQYSSALYTNSAGDLESLKQDIEKVTGCTISNTTSNNSKPKRIFGLGLAGTVEELSKASLTITAAQMVALNTTPISILSTDANYIYTPISASIVCDTIQASGTPSSALTVKIHQGSTYDATEEVLGCVVPTTVDAVGDYSNFEVTSGKKLSAGGEGLYVGASADDLGWDGVFTVVLYYSVTKIA